ncbi:MAG: endolytic transglycosylase MltG [Coriobacteriia bacterium]|nr:endolytic transglycosylase MltG [Coriobacteriia bacterium]
MTEQPTYRPGMSRRSERKQKTVETSRKTPSPTPRKTERKTDTEFRAHYGNARYGSEPYRMTESLKPTRSKGPIIAFAVLTVIVMLIGSILAAGWFVLLRPMGPDVEPGQEVIVTIPEGATTTQIADILVEHGIVDNPNMFRLVARQHDDVVFNAGRHRMATGSNYDEAIIALALPPLPENVVLVTVIEGLRIDDIALTIEEQMGIPAPEFAAYAHSAVPEFADSYPYLEGAYDNSLEGFLFPDTYELEGDATPHDVCARMLEKFDTVWNELEVPAERLAQHSVQELVTIASIIEREASLDDERPLVASVIENRLAIGMMLQMDSTFQFLLPPGRMNEVIPTIVDSQTESPYNTYVNYGLPPGPIGSASRASLHAAAFPAQSEYYYFALTSKTGEHTFSHTYEEHNVAVQKMMSIFGQ